LLHGSNSPSKLIHKQQESVTKSELFVYNSRIAGKIQRLEEPDPWR
jgi:hypothetical protein